MKSTTTALAVLLLAITSFFSALEGTAKPLKVYILSGQSNMQGHAHVRTVDVIGLDPKTAPMLKEMKNEDGSFRVELEVRGSVE